MATELLAPAGTLKSMRYAFAYGADAVYAGQPRYSLRVRENEFKQLDNLALACEEAHAQGKQFYLASNLSPHNAKVRTYLKDLAPVIAMQPDALIMSDPGLIMMVRERWPEQTIHLSVQANAVNYASVRFWQKQGLKRVILSRELSLEEIAEIRAEVPDMELETFVHGALCIAYSGRCLLSGYMSHRDANQGACTNSCRWQYNVHEARTDVTGDLIAVDAATASPGLQATTPAASSNDDEPQDEIAVLLQEKSRPGEYMPAYEDEHGTYIMNSRDLRAVQHVDTLVKMGIHSLKIEGRTKSHYYVARVSQVYRRAIDDALAGRPFNPGLMSDLDHLANRGYTEGFYRRHTHESYQNYEQGVSTNLQQQFVGEIDAVDAKRGWLSVEVKNGFSVGDQLELVTPAGNIPFVLPALENPQGTAMQRVPGGGYRVSIPCPDHAFARDLPEDGGYALLMAHRA